LASGVERRAFLPVNAAKEDEVVDDEGRAVVRSREMAVLEAILEGGEKAVMSVEVRE
jgi:hypothetical protein